MRTRAMPASKRRYAACDHARQNTEVQQRGPEWWEGGSALSEKRELLFSVTIHDCEVQEFCTGGKGGQNQNRRKMGIRIIHHPSGARGEGREERSQLANKRRAWVRMAQTEEFKKWHRIECARRLGTLIDIEVATEKAMDVRNLKVEGKKDGKWAPIEECMEAECLGG